MAINLSPEQENVIISIAQKIRGSRGGTAKTVKKMRAAKRNAKLANRARKAA